MTLPSPVLPNPRVHQGPVTSAPPTAVANSAVPRAELGTAIDDYLAHGSANLQNIRRF
jgi:hypothetical protein